jgi:hypothetical protein
MNDLAVDVGEAAVDAAAVEGAPGGVDAEEVQEDRLEKEDRLETPMVDNSERSRTIFHKSGCPTCPLSESQFPPEVPT